jgi:hypothetical protein
LLAGAVIGGIASSAYGGYGYGYGPGYGYYDGGYAPAYYGGGYGGDYYGGYSPGYYSAGYDDGYAPVYSGYRYRRVIRPAFAYYGGGPRFHRWHHRYRHW